MVPPRQVDRSSQWPNKFGNLHPYRFYFLELLAIANVGNYGNKVIIASMFVVQDVIVALLVNGTLSSWLFVNKSWNHVYG